MNYSLYKQAVKLIKLAGDELADTMDTVPDTTTNMGPWDTLVNNRAKENKQVRNDLKTYEKLNNTNQNKQDDSTVPDMSLFEASMTTASPYFWYCMSHGLDPYAKEALKWKGPSYHPYYTNVAEQTMKNTWLNAMFPPKGGEAAAAKNLFGKSMGLGFMGLWGSGLRHEWSDTWEKLKKPNKFTEDYVEDATSVASTAMSNYAFATELMKSPAFLNAVKSLGVNPARFTYWARYNPVLFQLMVAQTMGQLGADELNHGTQLKLKDHNDRKAQENVIAARNAVDPVFTDNEQVREEVQKAVAPAREVTPGAIGNQYSRKHLLNNERPEYSTKKNTNYVITGYTPEGIPYYTPVEKTTNIDPNDAGTWGLTFSAAKNPTYWKNVLSAAAGGPLINWAWRDRTKYRPFNPTFDEETGRASFTLLNQNYPGVPAPRDPETGEIDPSDYLMVKATDQDGEIYYRPMTLAEFTNINSLPEEVANQPVSKNMAINRELIRTSNGTANRPSEMFGSVGESLVKDPGGALKQTVKGVKNTFAGVTQNAGESLYKKKLKEEEVRKSLPGILKYLYSPSALDSM